MASKVMLSKVVGKTVSSNSEGNLKIVQRVFSNSSGGFFKQFRRQTEKTFRGQSQVILKSLKIVLKVLSYSSEGTLK